MSSGQLTNGNRCGDPHTAPRCGAQTRRGTACQAPAMPNGRCRLHGGKSTGPRTVDGLERCRKANWKHGWYSQQSLAERRQVRELMRSSAQLLRELGSEAPGCILGCSTGSLTLVKRFRPSTLPPATLSPIVFQKTMGFVPRAP